MSLFYFLERDGRVDMDSMEGYCVLDRKLLFFRILKAFFIVLFEVWNLSHFWFFVWGLWFALWKLVESSFFLPSVLKFHSVRRDVDMFSSVLSGMPRTLSSLAFCSWDFYFVVHFLLFSLYFLSGNVHTGQLILVPSSFLYYSFLFLFLFSFNTL